MSVAIAAFIFVIVAPRFYKRMQGIREDIEDWPESRVKRIALLRFRGGKSGSNSSDGG